jgi:predicted nucleic acid-binding protein
VTAYFFDSSAVVKRYVAESGSDWINRVADPKSGHRIFIARITIVEVTAAVARRSREGNLPDADADSVIQRHVEDVDSLYRLIEMTRDVLGLATALARTHLLRAYDAVQLGAALHLQRIRLASRLPALEFVSSDVNLNIVAQRLGFIVLNPSDQP